MQAFATVTIDLQPIAVAWKEDGKLHVKIERDAQSAMAFYYANSLWGNEGALFAEDGSTIPAPKAPT